MINTLNSCSISINFWKTKFFFVPVDEIIGNGYDLSINRYKQVVYKEMTYISPEKIINGTDNELGLKQLLAQRVELLKELEQELIW